MNKLKKIGVSALAGSLVAFAGHAGELTVSGSANLTYTTKDLTDSASTPNNSTGNPFGSDSNLNFNGSGDVNGMTVSFFAAIQAGGGEYASNSFSVDMGDMGAIKFDQGVGGNGIESIDDKSPTAWEEGWDKVSASDGMTTTGAQNVFTYTNTIAGFGINAAYDTEIDDSRTAEGDTGAQAGTNIDGSNYSFAITNNTLIDGLDFGAGYGETDVKDGTTTGTDIETIIGYVNYTMGPITVGYTMGETSGGKKEHDMHQMQAYGIAFNVNENMSVSFNNHQVDYLKTPSVRAADLSMTPPADHSTDIDSINVAYSMGGASIKIQHASQEGSSTSATYEEDRTEVALSLAF